MGSKADMDDGSVILRKNWWLKALPLVLWAVVVCAGLFRLWTYSFEAALTTHAPEKWPPTTQLPRPRSATLVLAVHPRCSCTVATVGELAIAVAHSPRNVMIDALVYRPRGSSKRWSEQARTALMAAIPSIRVFDDPGAREATIFGALTSGQVLVYSGSGSLLFNGGITASRGHSGDNNGRDAVVALLRNEQSLTHSTPVFGCSLRNRYTER